MTNASPGAQAPMRTRLTELIGIRYPIVLRAAMVDGRPDLGVMAAGQVVGLIEDVPLCAELIQWIMAEARDCLDRLDKLDQA